MRRFPSWWLVPSIALTAACGKPADKPAEAPRPIRPRPWRLQPQPAGPQAIVTVIYNTPKSTAAFEKYYSEKHLPLVSSMQQEIGFTKAELTKFTSTLDGKKPTFYRQAELYFNSLDDAKKGMATDGFKKVGDDLKNFATGGLIGMVAVETGDKSDGAAPRSSPSSTTRPRIRRRSSRTTPPPPAARQRRPAGNRLRPRRPHQVRVEPRRLRAGQVPSGGALLLLDGRPQEGHWPRRASRRWATTSRISRPAASTASSASSSSLHLVILASREGWHTRELIRALSRARSHRDDRAVRSDWWRRSEAGRRAGARGRRSTAPTRCSRASFRRARSSRSSSGSMSLHRLEERGVRVMNSPRTIERTVDKFWTSALLERCGLPTPRHLVCETRGGGDGRLPRAGRRHRQTALRFDGTRHGAGQRRGDGVSRLPDDRADPRRVLPPADHRSRGARYPGVRDRRQGLRRHRAPGRRLANQSGAGRLRPAVPALDEWSALAVRAAAAVDAEYAGWTCSRPATARCRCSR